MTTTEVLRHRWHRGALALGLAAALLAAWLPVSAAADEGYPLRDSVAAVGDPTPDLVMRGRGWGHSAGLSQYGAYAMAREGRKAAQILAHYYPTTTLGNAPEDQRVRVIIDPPTPRNQPITAVDGDLLWRTCSPTDTGACPTIVQPRDETWSIRSVTDRPNRIQLRNAEGDPVFAVDGGQVWTEVSDRDTFREARTKLSVGGNCGTTAPVRCYAYGRFEFEVSAEQVRMTNQLPMEGYLRGIAEVPSSWGNDGPEALRAQAIIARSYVIGRGLSTCATARCQVFAGYGKEIAPAGSNWVDAVRATRGQVVRTAGGAIANTYYSSSHGGRTEASEDSWAYGGTVEYLRSVDDPWSLDGRNPMRSWTSTARNADVRRITGIGTTVTRVEIRSRTDGGSPSAVRVHALDGRTLDFTTTVSSQQTRTCNRRHAGNSFRCDLPVTGTRNAAGQSFLGSGDRIPSSQITSIGFAPFTDDVGSLHEYATVWANRAGIAQGTDATTYSPRRAVTRAQMASFLDRTFDIPPASGQPFSDVDGGPHAASVAAVAAAGIAQGYDDGTYRPSQPVTRAQMATFLTRAMGLTPQDHSFSDVSGVHSQNVGALAASNITAGCDADRFCPQDPVRRDQMATFLYRAARSLR